jgi:hypothetical protein
VPATTAAIRLENDAWRWDVIGRLLGRTSRPARTLPWVNLSELNAAEHAAPLFATPDEFQSVLQICGAIPLDKIMIVG